MTKDDSGYLLRNQSSGARSSIQLIALISVIFGTIVLIARTKVLLLPIILSVTIYFVLNPFVNWLERAGRSRTTGAALATIFFFVPAGLMLSWVISSIYSDLAALETAIPRYINFAQDRLHSLEGTLVERFAWLAKANLSSEAIGFVETQSRFFLSNSPEIISAVLWTTVLVPILSFFLLKDAAAIRNLILNLTPNRFFEKCFNLSFQIEKKIGAFTIAKLAEAFIVGLFTLAGLVALDFPYPVMLSVIAGVTNVIPYFGPLLGFAPILAIPFFVPLYENLMIPALVLSLAVNIVDILIIFPFLVSRVIDLHPLVVLLSVIIGGNFGGPVGLIVAIPIAAIIKVTFLELMGMGQRQHRH